MIAARPSFPRHRIPALPAAAVLGSLLVGAGTASPGLAQCPADSTVQNYTGTSGTPCPCFIPDEEAGSVFTIPPEHYPVELLSVGIFWASAFGGTPNQLEYAVRVYNGGLPDPGPVVGEILGPVLTDGFLNEYDMSPLQIMIDSGPVTATLRFLNQNNNSEFNPSVVYDAGCQGAKNVVYAIPEGWFDACLLGVPGDWIFTLKYRPCVQATGVGDDPVVMANTPVALFPPRPNPVRASADLQFVLAEPAHVSLRIFDVAGREVAAVVDGRYPGGGHGIRWTPPSGLQAGVYFARMTAGEHEAVQKIVYRP